MIVETRKFFNRMKKNYAWGLFGTLLSKYNRDINLTKPRIGASWRHFITLYYNHKTKSATSESHRKFASVFQVEMVVIIPRIKESVQSLLNYKQICSAKG